MNRATSVYTITVQTAAPNHVCGFLITRSPVRVDGSGVTRDQAFIRVRVADDAAALVVARETTDGLPFTLVTGYGVNQREVPQP